MGDSAPSNDRCWRLEGLGQLAKGGAPGSRISWQTISGQNNIVSNKVVQDFLFCVIPLFEENISLPCLGEAEVFKSRGNNEAQKILLCVVHLLQLNS